MTGHVHAPSPRPAPIRRAARWAFVAVLVPMALATLAGVVALWPYGALPTIPATAGATTQAAVVTDMTVADKDNPEIHARLGGVVVAVAVPPEYVPEMRVGDPIRVMSMPDVQPGYAAYVFQDFQRGPPMALLVGLFVVLVALVARWRGLASLLGLAIALGVVWRFTLPALLVGRPGGAVGLVSAAAIMFVVLYLAHGVSLRTSTALAGTLVGLAATAAIAAWASGAAHLTGLSDEYALDLMSYAPQVRLRQVLLAGTVLAGLGVLNDVTVTQASAVWELHDAQPAASWRRLVTQGMRIGRDHIASTIYTIAFAYVAAALPLVLLVSMSTGVPLLEAVTSGELAEEVARTLVGSLGLVLAIPLTTMIAALVVTSGRRTRSAPPSELPNELPDELPSEVPNEPSSDEPGNDAEPARAVTG
ncbi:MAG TPA: YibE/F family protein [Cellulomonas sp.]